MNIAQLHERVKNLSDGQLANLSQRGDMTASLALAELNTRNDLREASAMQMGKAPTIAEQERAKVMQGIGVPPIDPNMISPQMAQGVGNPAMMPRPQPIGSGVGQLQSPMMTAAGGGLISLADGGLPEDYVPFSERSGLQELGGFFFGEDSDILGDLGYGARDALSDPTNYLMAIPAGGVGLKYGAKLTRPYLKKAYEAAKKRGYTEKFADFVRGAWRNPRREWVDLEGGLKKSEKGPRIFKEKLGKFSWPRAITSTSLGGAGIASLMGGDDAAPEGQRELMGPPKPSAALMEQNRRANELREKLKAAEDAAKAGKGGEGASAAEKGGLGGILAGLGPATWLGGLTTAANLFSGKDVGTAAEKGITTGLAVKQQEADAAYKKGQLEIDKARNKIYKAQLDVDMAKIRADLGWSPEKMEKARAKWETENPEALALEAEVKKEYQEQADINWWPFDRKINKKEMLKDIKRVKDAAFAQYLRSLQVTDTQLDVMNYLDGVNTELRSRGE